MSQPHDFPFDITDVAELLHLRIRRPSPQGLYVDCPICNDKRGKMHINTQSDTWRCNYCDESGGMLALYAKVHSISTSTAYREISDALLNGVNLSDHAVKFPDILFIHIKPSVFLVWRMGADKHGGERHPGQ